jgi:hypothetical protein
MNKLAITFVFAARLAYADDAAQAPKSPPHALVVHVAPTSSPAGAPIVLEAMIDAPYAEALSVRWREVGPVNPVWHEAGFERSSAGGWFATLPPATTPGVEYYIRGKDTSGAEIDHFASEQAPHVVHVDPSVVDRLETLDRARLGGFDNEISLDVMAHDFGNRYGLTDQFMRGELVYTHRFLRVVHEVGFGFGSISGRTPLMSDPSAMSELHDLRYGFGQVRLRLDPSIFLDGRVGLGVSQLGFEQNVRGQLTLGKPWRSCLQFGAEYLVDLGPSAWARLQWDTAPPLLMGASVVRTDLPGAVLSRFGIYIAYDVAWRITDRLSLKAQVSYGPRDGQAHFGGGAGTAVAF